MASILIIDDDENFRSTLAQTLEAAGHVVMVAADGLEGCRLFRANPCDLVLTDLVMPHSGLAALQVLRGQFPSLKVIAMSGGGKHRLDYARSLGAPCTLAKPFTTQQLASALDQTLGVSRLGRTDSAAHEP